MYIHVYRCSLTVTNILYYKKTGQLLVPIRYYLPLIVSSTKIS